MLLRMCEEKAEGEAGVSSTYCSLEDPEMFRRTCRRERLCGKSGRNKMETTASEFEGDF